ncbi:hypothetical protein HNP46_000048 [Pseudomonas nitritireducens]|uniref:Uncharacterized protein n=1 Tax=Pseudomonas nitroreducens TaxID=46680 RepID=A0A7W7KEA4_PSENT|nr:hypothetical protein [Pseudomonas nitritireducens]MBB4861237.1 hypothetical protein [Pseudomonas nitritireducens]
MYPDLDLELKANPELEKVINPPEAQDEHTAFLRAQGYRGAKRLEDGTYAVLIQLFSTVAIGLHVTRSSLGLRFCFSSFVDGMAQWEQLTTSNAELEDFLTARPVDLKDREEIRKQENRRNEHLKSIGMGNFQ